MRNKKLLEKIQERSKEAVCPIAEWRSPAVAIQRYAMEFLRENCSEGGKFTSEIDPDNGNLCLYWEQGIAWNDITYSARTLAEITKSPHSFESKLIRSVVVKCRYEIPMFATSESEQVKFSDGLPLRSDFTQNLEAFVRKWDSLNREPLDKVFSPLSEDLCTRVKTKPYIS
jgi:hypothetical protein